MAENGHVEEVLRHSRALRSEAGAMVEEIRGAAEHFSRKLDLRGRMERNPWATMAVAAGVGYVLGGGLFTRLTGTMVRVGTRVLLVPLLKSQLESLAQGAAGQAPAAGFGGSEDGAGGM